MFEIASTNLLIVYIIEHFYCTNVAFFRKNNVPCDLLWQFKWNLAINNNKKSCLHIFKIRLFFCTFMDFR